MNTIFSYSKAKEFVMPQDFNGGKRILVGGCFDIVHVGHITFLEKAKQQGDFLIVLLESDARIRQLKGSNRPINTQLDRATVVAALKAVDAVILLPDTMANEDFDDLVKLVKPAIIATTRNDPYIDHKLRQAKLVHGEVISVLDHMKEHSTTQKAKKII